MPQGLSIYKEPSIGNRDSKCLEICHKKLQAFSLTLTLEVMRFCDKTTGNVPDGIEKA